MNEVLVVNEVGKSFDGIKALVTFSCSVNVGEVVGLIGANGAGKTTLFNVISGFAACESGSVWFKGLEMTYCSAHLIAMKGIRRTFQNLRLIRQMTVLENVLLAFSDQPGESLRNIFFNWRCCLERERANVEEALELLREAALVDKADDPAEDLSYGQQKLLSLVCCLAGKPDVLLLDEPVAGIAPEMTDRILKTIRGLPEKGKSVLLIEHNLDAVMQVCDRVIFMDAGTKVCEGTPDEVRNDPRVIEAYLD